MRRALAPSWPRLRGTLILAIVVALVATGCMRPRRPRATTTTTPTTAPAATTTTSLRGHGEHGGDHHSPGGDDKGWSKLTNGHQHSHEQAPLDAATQAELDRQLAVTRQLMDRYPTVADAVAAGARRAGPFGPGLGVHYSNPSARALIGPGPLTEQQLLSPMLIYNGTDPTEPLIGFMYLSMGTAPEGFAGPNDNWHYHQAVCVNVGPTGLDTPLAADREFTREQCAAAGGTFIAITNYMVHVWNVPGWENPDGLFAELNPKITCPDGTYHTVPDDQVANRTSICLA